MMNIQELQNAISALFRGTDLALPASTLPAGSVADFIQSLPYSTLTLVDAAIQPVDMGFEISGQIPGNWEVPGFDAGQIGAPRVAITFTQPAGNPAPAISAVLNVTGGMLNLCGVDASMKGCLTAKGQLALSAEVKAGAEFALTELGNFIWGSRGADSLPVGVEMVFSSFPVAVQSLDMTFSLDRSVDTNVGLVIKFINLPDWQPLGPENNLFAMSGIRIGLLTSYTPTTSSSGNYSYGSLLRADISIDKKTFGVCLDFSGAPIWIMRVQPDDAQLLPALDSLAQIVGGPALSHAVSAGLKDAGCDSLTLDKVEVGFDIQARKLCFVSIGGIATVEGGQVALNSMLYPEFEISLMFPPLNTSAAPAKGIDLNALVARIYEPIAGFPKTEISQLSLYAAPGAPLYQFGVGVVGSWAVAQFDQQSLKINGVSLSVSKDSSGLSGRIYGAGEIAGVDFNISASKQAGAGSGWILEGQAANTKAIRMAQFFVAFFQWVGMSLPSDVHTPRVKLSNLSVRYDTGSQSFDFKGESRGKADFPVFNGITWQLDLTLAVHSGISPVTNKRVLSGELTSEVTIAEAVFDFSYQLAQDTSIVRCSWLGEAGTGLSLNDMLSAFGLGDPPILSLPGWLDPKLRSVQFQVDLLKEEMLLAATTESGMEVFLQIGKITGSTVTMNKYTAVFGIALPQGLKFSGLPGPAGTALAPLDKFLSFDYACILVASDAIADFSPPSMAGQATNPFAPIGASCMTLGQGVSVALRVDFGNSGNPVVQNLATVLPQTTVVCQVTLDFSADQYTLEGSLGGQPVSVGGSKGSNSLHIDDAMVKVILSPGNAQAPVAFQVQGSVQVPIGDKTLYATARLSFDEDQADASFMLRETIDPPKGPPVPVSLPNPMGIKGIALDSIGGEIGVQFEPPSVVMGLEGSFTIGGEAYGSDQFAFVVAFEESLPNPVFLHVHLAELDMQVILTACLDVTTVPDFMNSIKLSELSIYWCETATTLPDGTVTQAGFGFNGILGLFSFSLYASLKIRQAQGISGAALMSPIHMTGLAVTGQGKGMIVKQIYVNDQWETITQKLLDQSKGRHYPTRSHQVIAPGGPVLEFNTVSSPYFSASLEVTLLGLVREQVYAQVSNSGFTFDLGYSIANVVDFTLACTLQDEKNFSGSAAFSFGLRHRFGAIDILGYDLGGIDLDTDFNAQLALTINTDTGFQLVVSGNFDFEGITKTFPTLTLGASFTNMGNLVDAIIQQIEAHLEELFSSELLLARQIILAGLQVVESISQQAVARAEQIEQDAAQAAQDMIAEAKTLAAETGEEAAAEAARLEQEAQAIIADTQVQLERIAQESGQAVAALEAEAKSIAAQAEQEAQAIKQEAESVVAAVSSEIAQLETSVEREIQDLREQAMQEAGSILAEAASTVDSIRSLSVEAIQGMESATTDILNQIATVEKALEQAAQTVLDATVDLAKDAWNEVEDFFSC